MKHKILDEELYLKIKNFIIYQNDFMVIFKSTRGDYIVWNIKKEFSKDGKRGHSHLKSLTQAKLIADNIAKNKFPKTRNMYLLSAYIRCADNEEYLNKIKSIIEVRRQKGRNMNYKNFM